MKPSNDLASGRQMPLSLEHDELATSLEKGDRDQVVRLLAQLMLSTIPTLSEGKGHERKDHHAA